MREIDRDWMIYLETEVQEACQRQGLGYQIRRKWTVRDKPVSQSPLEDYEWKLIPGPVLKRPDKAPTDFDEGSYYVLSLDRSAGRFVLHHDTSHCGTVGPHWSRRPSPRSTCLVCPRMRTAPPVRTCQPTQGRRLAVGCGDI